MAFYDMIRSSIKPIALGIVFHHTPMKFSFPHDSEYAFWTNCLSITLLAVFLSFLLAFRPVLERGVWSASALRATWRKFNVKTLPWALKPFGDAPLNHVGVAAQLFVLRARRAMFEVLIAFVGYLLLVAIMRLDVAYFVSGLVGAFFGTLITGTGDITDSFPGAVNFEPYVGRR